jgi:hypothetical protein
VIPPHLIDVALARRRRGLTVAEVHALATTVLGYPVTTLDDVPDRDLKQLLRVLRSDRDLHEARSRWRNPR